MSTITDLMTDSPPAGEATCGMIVAGVVLAGCVHDECGVKGASGSSAGGRRTDLQE